MQERMFYAPGRVEIGGNHTDHQRGRVIAAAINMETKCVAVVNKTGVVYIKSDGFDETVVDLTDLTPRESEKGTTAALVRGIAAWFSLNGHPIGGFDGRVTSDLPAGIGLSSSAAFEVLVGNVFKGLYNADVSTLDIALAGQFAENVYFGKPCGLMDQAASSFGGLTMFDFNDPQKPIVTPININKKMDGYALCVVATGDSHADMTDDYAAIPAEMKAVANCFGKEDLRAVDANEFFKSIGKLRSVGDRAVLRAMHFFEENERVLRQAEALQRGDIPVFLRLVYESGFSSHNYLQNIFSPTNPKEQGLSLALALCEQLIRSEGAYRVHGGGFAGTVLAFVPVAVKEDFTNNMCNVFGENCCHFLKFSQKGGREMQNY